MDNLIPSTGALGSIHDERTVNHDELTQAQGGVLPLLYKVDYSGKHHKNQKKVGICTAAASVVIDEWYQQTGFVGSMEWLYKMGKVLIDNNTTEGSSIFTMLKVAQKYGIPSESLFPSNCDRSYNDFMLSTTISQAMLDDAFKHRIPGYASVPVNADSLMKAIVASKGGIIVRMSLGNTFWVAEDGSVTWDSAKINPLRAPKTVTSGHAIAMVGYENVDGKLMFRVRNSWGDDWNLQGDGTFDFAVMAPYVTEAWAILEKTPEIKFKFTKDLSEGMKDADVVELQKFLRKQGFPVVTEGTETNYFGPMTLGQVVAWQKANKLSPAQGYFGPKSRNLANSLI